jgi:hypothetical protein
MNRCLILVVIACGLAAVSACGGGDESCDPVAQSGCAGGEVCEQVQDGEPACFPPVVLRGAVFDLADMSAIEGAHVVALDPNRAPASSVAVSDADGEYELATPATRQSDGTPVSLPVLTLRADAAGYQAFPSGVRQALPIDTSQPIEDDGALVIESSLTDVGMLALGGDAGSGVIGGTLEGPAGGGVLVVAESGGAGYSATADRDGAFTIFNLPEGEYVVTAYARGVNYIPTQVTVPAASAVGLELSDDGASTVTGKVEIVNPGDGDGTSVILVVASTFDAALGRGEAVPGLRAPELSSELDVTGDFTIEGVPAGTYVILAAFENDALVRDPDTCIAGTSFITSSVEADQTLAIEDSFKVTGALDVIGPGATGPEEVGGELTFSWVDDSSEDEYRVVLLDSFGNTVWETVAPRATGENPAVIYDGAALEPGMYYQFRATSVRTATESTCEISQTEDLKGVFFVAE